MKPRLFALTIGLLCTLGTVSAHAMFFDPSPETLFMQEKRLLENYIFLASTPLVTNIFPDTSKEKIALELGKLNRTYAYIEEVYRDLPDTDVKGSGLKTELTAALNDMHELVVLGKILIEKNQVPSFSVMKEKVKKAISAAESATKALSTAFPSSLAIKPQPDRTQGIIKEISSRYYSDEKVNQCYQMGALLADDSISPSNSARLITVLYKIEQYCSGSRDAKVAFWDLYEALNRAYAEQQTGLKGSINGILNEIATTNAGAVLSPGFRMLPKSDQCEVMNHLRESYRQLSTRMFIDIVLAVRINDQVPRIKKAIKTADAYCSSADSRVTLSDVQSAMQSATDAAKTSLRRIRIN